MEVRLGNLHWQTTNLSTKRFLNGDEIQLIKSQAEFELFQKNKKPGCHYLDFDERNQHLGMLYNSYAIKDKRGLFEKTYRIPTPEEWKHLFRIVGYLFEEDDSYLWSTGSEYVKKRHKLNIEALKRLKSTKGWKKGHSGNNACGFMALATLEETRAGWLWIGNQTTLTGGVFLGNSSAYKKIGVGFREHDEWSAPSEFIRLVRDVSPVHYEPLKFSKVTWIPGYLGYNLLDDFTNFDLVESETEWGIYKQKKKAAKCFYENASYGIPLFNYYASKDIKKNLQNEYKIPSSKDYQALFESFPANEIHQILDVYNWHLHFIRLPKTQKEDFQQIFDFAPIGMRRVKYVTHWEGEALYNYGFFSGKGNIARFWTSDDCIFSIGFDDNIVKHSVYKLQKDSSYLGLGLPIKLIKK